MHTLTGYTGGTVSWFKCDDKFHSHPKVEGLSLEAVGLWLLAGSWCADQGTDGRISETKLRQLGRCTENKLQRVVNELVRTSLWERVGTADGTVAYQFHDWADYNPETTRQDNTRKLKSARQKRWREKKRADVDASTQRLVDVSVDALHQRRGDVAETPPPTRPVYSDPLRGSAHPAPTQGALIDAPPHAETEGQRVNRLTRIYTDRVPLSKFVAVAGVVRAAVRAGHTDEQITAGLGLIADEKRAVTIDTLRIAIEAPTGPRRQRHTPWSNHFSNTDYLNG